MGKTKKAPARSAALVKSAPSAKTPSVLPGKRSIESAAHARAESLLAEIERRKQRIAEDFYDIGVNLRELYDKKLFGAIGYPTFGAMLADRAVMSLSQAHRLIRIVRSLPRERALAVGSEKAALLASYAQSTPEPDNPTWLLDQGTLPNGKTVAEATTRELAAALKKTRGTKPRKASTPEEASARTGARRAQAALRKRGAKGAVVEVVRRGGDFWLRVELPAESASVLGG